MAEEEKNAAHKSPDVRTVKPTAGGPLDPARERESAQRREWEDAKRAFGRQALEEALTFMRADNEMVRHCNTIMAAVAREVEANPGRFLHGVTGGEHRPGKTSAEDIVGGQGDILGNILDFIKEDKKFFLELIANLLPF